METMRAGTLNRKMLALLLMLFLVSGMLHFGSPPVYAKGSLSPDDCVKNVLIYAKNSAGDEVLVSQLNVSAMLDYLNANFEDYGKVHNYSVLDRYVTPVHQEAQGFTVPELLDYALSQSTLANIDELGLSFSGEDAVAFWEIDGNAFDAVDTYTCDSLYGVTRYNFPALYANWDYKKQVYADEDAIWESREEEQALLSITAYSQRYIASPLYGTGAYNMENYFDNQGLLDTARTMRLMLPMTVDDFENQILTANNSRYGICYILFDPTDKPDFSLGTVAKPTCKVIDGDADVNDEYEAGYCYFTLNCATEGASIYYNGNSVSSYMPTDLYTAGQKIKVKKMAGKAALNIRAVKEGCSDAGVQTISSDQPGNGEEEVAISFSLTPANAVVTVKNSGGTAIAANPDGTFTLVLGETYSYEVCAAGYLTKFGSFTVTDAENIEVVLNQAGEEAAISFSLTPANAVVTVKNSGGKMVAANPDGTYTLILGEIYTYEVCAAGYLTQSGSLTVTGAENIVVVLNKDQIATSGPNQIILSWIDNAATSQTVIWNDNSGSSEVVQYVAETSYTDEGSFSNANQAAATSKTVGYDEKAKTYYEATMTGLNPATKYYYRVGSDAEWSNVYSFTTAASAAQNFSFMYLGDVQYDTTAAAEYPAWGTLLAGAYAANPDIAFGLMGGDMVNSGSNMNDWTYFLSYASDVFSRIPMMTANGNHESNFIGGKPKFYTEIMALPENGPAGFEEEFYSFDYGTAHVTILNSWVLSSEQNLNEAQRTAISDWITRDLAAARGAKFRIVMLHHPAYALANDTVSGAVLANWVPLLEAGQVDLVLCGHQHVYSRSYPLRAGEIDYKNGITYVMGNSGQKFYSNADASYQEKIIFNKSTYQILHVNGDALSLSSYDSQGNLVDSWSTTARTTILVGDVNNDGDINMDDVNAVTKAVLNSNDYCSTMDINQDAIVDMRDAQLVLKIYLNKAA